MEEQQQRRDTSPHESMETQQMSLMKSQSQDTIRWMLDFSKELEQLRRDLRGEYKEGDGWIVDDNRRMLNDKGVNEIIRRLRMAFSKGTPLSNMSEDAINADAKDFNFHLAVDCYRHSDEWDFKSNTDRSSLVSSISWTYYKLLLRAKGALQLRQLSDNIQRHETVMYGNPQMMQQQRGGEWWKFWGAKK